MLLVDDEPGTLDALGEILEECGYAVVSAWDGEDAVAIADLYQPDVLLTDQTLGTIDGVTTIERIREECPRAKTILMSGHISVRTRERAVKHAVDHIIEKPVSIPDLLERMAA